MKRKRLLTLLGSVCLAVMLLVPLAVSCGPATPEEAAEEIAALESKLAAEKAKVSSLEDEIAELEEALAAAKAPVEAITWRFNVVLSPPPTHAGVTDEYQWFINRVEELSHGRLQMDLYAGGVLGFFGPEIVRAVGDNLVEMSSGFYGWVASEIYFLDLCGLYNLTRNLDETEAVLKALRPMTEEAYADYGALLLVTTNPISYRGGQSAVFFMTKEINRREDFSGLIMRTPGPILVEALVEPLGMAGAFIPWGEATMALQTGVVDGVLTTFNDGLDIALHEPASYAYCATYPYTIDATFICASKDAFEALPGDLQEIVLQVSSEFEERQGRISRDPGLFGYETYQESIDIAQSEGCELRHLPEGILEQMEKDALEYLDVWIAEGGPQVEKAVQLALAALEEMRKQ